MAEAWGSQVYHSTYNNWQGGVNAWVESYPNETQAVIVVQARFYTRWAISSSQFYAYTECSGYGSGEQQFTVNSGNSAYYATGREQRFTVNRPQGDGGNIWCVGRIRNTGSYTPGTSEAGVNVWVDGIAYKQPHPPKNAAVSYVSDNRADLTWQGDYTGMDGLYPWIGVYVDRATDDGSWVNIATLNWDAVNYSDNSISPNHKYVYRLRSYGQGGTSDDADCSGNPIYTTPAAPQSVVLSKVSDTTVSVDITGAAPYASSYDIEYSLNDGDWQSAGSTPTFPFQYNPGGGTAKFRVRAVRDSLKSDWTESDTIATITPPLAPTVTVGDGRGVVPTGEPIIVTWVPNHPDASEQSQAQVEVTIGNGQATVHDVQGSVTTYTIEAQQSATTIKVRVCTHGLDPDWGAWSSVQSVRVAVPPNVYFTSPSEDGAMIGAVPLEVEWVAEDATGISYQSLQLLSADGSGLLSKRPSKDVRSFAITSDMYAFENLTDYSLRLTVGGGSGLSTVVERSFKTNWVGPAKAQVSISYGDDLSASLVVSDGSAYGEPAESITMELPPGSLLPGLVVNGPADGSASEISIIVEDADGTEYSETEIDLGGLSLATGGTIEIDAQGSVTMTDPDGTPHDLGSISLPVLPVSPCTVTARADAPVTIAAKYPETVSFDVYRVLPDGSQWLVSSGLLNAQTARDPLPPLNVDYEYMVASYAATGTTTQGRYAARVESGTRAAYNFGDSASVCMVTQFDFEDSESFSHDGEAYHFAGQALPMWYQTASKDATGSQSFHLIGQEAYEQLRSISRSYAVGWLRTPHGTRIRGVIEFSYDRKAPSPVTEVSADTTEVVWQEAW